MVSSQRNCATSLLFTDVQGRSELSSNIHEVRKKNHRNMSRLRSRLLQKDAEENHCRSEPDQGRSEPDSQVFTEFSKC